ncbi:MAG: phenylalanine--tRNA ligase subunit beta [Gammaproteobacteria bacterium]|jgi:phenylalanyl-tRNA synthetase beta chain
MKISMQWLQEWVDVEGTAEALAHDLTIAGLEVDSVERINAGVEDVVAARVDSVAQHPQADRLKVCRVFDGKETFEVVCGAPNVRAGMLVPFARVGARLPGDVRIKASKLRGVRSNGMLCSGKELLLEEDSTGLFELDTDVKPGRSISDVLELDDAVIDIDLTPNRGDCFSVIGIAREIAARARVPLHPPEWAPAPVASDDRFPSVVADFPACPRLCTRIVTGVNNRRPVPLWLRERLRRSGLRSISPIVDVTNYVMLEYGQPLHAYDRERINDRLDVRFARSGESLKLLNENVIELQDDVLVIADAGGAIGLAGIMGGATTGVSADTSAVIFESAFFSPDAIAGRARRFGLHTDASVRFERGVDPTHQIRAIERATALLIEIAGGEPGPLAVYEDTAQLPQRAPITLRHTRLNQVLGLDVASEDVSVMLTGLEMEAEPCADGWRITPPGFRFDIAIEEDLIEEIGRMIGYDNIPVTPGANETHTGSSTEQRVAENRAVDVLVDRGYQEIITYSFIDPELAQAISPGADQLELANPISSDLTVMRRSLWPGLLVTARRNQASQIDDLRLFEYGPQFDETGAQVHVFAGLASGKIVANTWDGPARDVDFYDVKRDLEVLLSLSGLGDAFRFVAAQHPALRPGQSAGIFRGDEAVGWLGTVHPGVIKRFELRASCVLFAVCADAVLNARVPKFSEYSRLPHIRRDVAFVVDESVSAQQLIDLVTMHAGDDLAEVLIFDLYRGKGIDATRKSIGLGLILQNASRTLTDADADKVVSSVTQNLQREIGATIRT